MGLAKTPPKKISSRSKPSEHRWLVKQASGGYQCNICLTSFSKKKTSTFNQHPKSDKHRSSLALLNSKAAQSMQLYQTKKKEIKAAVLQAEIEISACIGQHTAIRSKTFFKIKNVYSSTSLKNYRINNFEKCTNQIMIFLPILN